jgi:opacity protein-like surface antigen
MRLTTGLIAAAIAIATAPAMAAEPHFYTGASVGTGSFAVNTTKATNIFENGFANAGINLDTTSVDKNSDATTWSIFAGYRLNDWLATEISYLDLSGAEYKGEGTARFGASTGIVPVTTKAEWSASGWPISVLGIWPITDTWEVFGRVGVFIGDVDLKYSVKGDISGNSASESVSQSSTQFIGGAGVQANFLDSWFGRLEWQGMPSIGNDKTGSTDWYQVAASIAYKF